jgi:hypothetical protein
MHFLQTRTFERNETPRIKRDIKIQHRAHAVYHGRVHHRYRRVQIPSYLAARAGEVEHRRASGFVDVDLELDGGPVVEVVDRREGGAPRAFGDVAQEVADGLFGVGADVVHVFLHGGEAVVFYDCKHAALDSGHPDERRAVLAWMSWMPLWLAAICCGDKSVSVAV